MRVFLFVFISLSCLEIQAQLNTNKIWITKDYDIFTLTSDTSIRINNREFTYLVEDSIVTFTHKNGGDLPFKIQHFSLDSISLLPLSKWCKYLLFQNDINDRILLLNPNSFFKDRMKFDYIIYEHTPGYSIGAHRVKFQIDNNGQIYLNDLFEGQLNPHQQDSLIYFLEYSCLDWVKVVNSRNIDVGSNNFKIRYNDKLIELHDFKPNYWDSPFTSLLLYMSRIYKEIEFTRIPDNKLPFIYKE